jgi:hypothetical protein
VPEYSSLWQPLHHPPPLTASTLVVAGWCALVFVYLALPLVRSVGVERLGHLDLGWARNWKF